MKYIIIISLVFLASCASTKKSAIKLTEEGLHEAALIKWVQAYREDPDDVEVQVGLKICQEKVSNDRLVRIRDLRIANEEEQSLIELQKLIQLQSFYEIKLDFNSSTFQGNETQFLWKHQKRQIENLIKQNKSLGAELRNRKYKDIFQSFTDMKEIEENIKNNGKLQCNNLKKDTKDAPFFSSFVAQYCRFFVPEKNFKLTSPIGNYLYSELRPTVDVKDGEAQPLITSFDKGFKSSPWFHPEGKRKMPLSLNGQFSAKKDSKTINQAHDYTVEIPYTDYQSVMKTKYVTVPVVREECKYDVEKGNVCERVSDTETKEETYWEQEPVTRYRSETRIHYYQAQKNSLVSSIQLTGTFMNSPFSFMANETEEKIIHDSDLPNIGLSPQTDDVSTPQDHYFDYSTRAGHEFRLELSELWIKQFCHLPAKRIFKLEAENMMKCRRSEVYPEAMVDTWFLNTFGVTSKEAQSVVGKF